MMRLALVLGTGFLALSACGEDGAPLPASDAVECALAGSAGFAEECTMERHEGEEGRYLILRHPDGAFRRFEIGVPGEGLITADGMEPADITQGDGMVEVRVGADRYRLPVQ